MGRQKAPIQLAKFLTYILARRPDEFGLVPDRDGFVKIKELLKAVNEEQDWKYVRRSHIDEIIITLPSPLFEFQANLIRAVSREQLPLPAPAENLPKLLYTCVRRKAYPFIIEKGIHPMGHRYVILSSSKDLAEKIGKRMDHLPVQLAVNAEKTVRKGQRFLQAGDLLYLAENIPPDCFSGPPLPKEKTEAKRNEASETALKPKTPGTFYIDLDEKIRPKPPEGKKKKSEIDWKADRKILRKQKRKRERPPWRR